MILRFLLWEHVYQGLFFKDFYLFIWPCHMAYGILIPQPGIKLRPLEVKVGSPNHWTPKEFPRDSLSMAW